MSNVLRLSTPERKLVNTATFKLYDFVSVLSFLEKMRGNAEWTAPMTSDEIGSIFALLRAQATAIADDLGAIEG